MAACQEEQSNVSNFRIYPNVIRSKQEDGSFKVVIKKTNFEFVHFKIVDQLQFIPPHPEYNSNQFNPSSPSTINDENIEPLPPPPPPYKLKRSFRETDRPIYDPLYWKSTNKQNNCNSKKYLLRCYTGNVYDYKTNNWRPRNPHELCKVQLCCHNLEEDSYISWIIWQNTYWNNENNKLLFDLDWKISKDNSFINYQVPGHF